MHHSTKRRVVLGMTTGGLLLTGAGMSVAQADASADGAAAHSPGVLSGNLVQAPIDAPINVCGNVIDVIGALDTAAGNHCGNADAGSRAPGGNASSAHGVAKDSPGILSGNVVQAPIDVPINVCGNSVSGVGVGDAAFDNTCSNGAGHGTHGAGANGGSRGSAGVGSGNTVQLPIDAPVNLCGNSVSGVGVGDAAFDNTCSNGDTMLPPPPPRIPPRHPAPPTCGCHPTPTATTPTAPSTPSSPATPTPPTTPSSPWTPSAPATPGAPGTISPTSGAPAPGTHGSTGKPGSLAQTGVGTGTLVAPLGAGVLGGGGLLLRKLSRRSNG